MGEKHYDLIVIGSGPAGEKGAAQAAYFGKSVALVEKEPVLGGAAANTGTLRLSRRNASRRVVNPNPSNITGLKRGGASSRGPLPPIPRRRYCLGGQNTPRAARRTCRA